MNICIYICMSLKKARKDFIDPKVLLVKKKRCPANVDQTGDEFGASIPCMTRKL